MPSIAVPLERRTFLLMLLGCGCASAAGRGGSAPAIQTTQTRYALVDSAGIARLTIRMQYRNDAKRPVFFPTCRGPQPPRLEKRVGDEWVVAFAPVVPYCLGTPIMVRPGDTFDYSFTIVAGMPGTSFAPRFSVSEVPGTYRVLWEAFYGTIGDPTRPTEVRDMVPLEQRVSNEFQIAR